MHSRQGSDVLSKVQSRMRGRTRTRVMTLSLDIQAKNRDLIVRGRHDVEEASLCCMVVYGLE